MPFGLGSKSAQTPSESSQQSKSNTHNVALTIAGLDQNTQYRVYHMWRKVGSVAKRGMPHHSQIFITDLNDNWLRSLGLFANAQGMVVYEEEWNDPNNPYNLSTSYKPNPCVVTGQQIDQAVQDATLKCGPEYKLLHNNCQKFARLLMTALEASHNRELFHP